MKVRISTSGKRQKAPTLNGIKENGPHLFMLAAMGIQNASGF